MGEAVGLAPRDHQEAPATRLGRSGGALEAIFCPVEDPEFCLARNILCATTRKNEADKLKEQDFQMFNSWASMMNRCGHVHELYQQAVAKGPSGEYFKNGGTLEDWMRNIGAI